MAARQSPTYTTVHRKLRRLAAQAAGMPRTHLTAAVVGIAEELEVADLEAASEEAVRALWVRLARLLDGRALREQSGQTFEQARAAAQVVIAMHQDPGAGRPPIGRTVEVRLPGPSIEGLERWQGEWETTAAEAHRRIFAAGLAALER